MLRKASAKVSSISARIASATGFPSFPSVDSGLRNHFVHVDVVGLHGDKGIDLTLEGQCDKGRIGAGALQELVVVTEAVAETPAVVVEGHARHYDQIQLASIDALVGVCAQLDFRLQDLVH